MNIRELLHIVVGFLELVQQALKELEKIVWPETEGK